MVISNWPFKRPSKSILLGFLYCQSNIGYAIVSWSIVLLCPLESRNFNHWGQLMHHRSRMYIFGAIVEGSRYKDCSSRWSPQNPCISKLCINLISYIKIFSIIRAYILPFAVKAFLVWSFQFSLDCLKL